MRSSVKRGQVRAGAASLAVGLVLGTLPVLLPSAAHAAPTALSPAEARSAFVKARVTTSKKLLTSGGYVTTTRDDQGDEDFKHSGSVTQARIDAKRHTMRQNRRGTHTWPPGDASAAYVPCGTGGSDHWTLAKDKVGRWVSLGDRSKAERQALARIGKPSARWAKHGGKGTRLAPRVQVLIEDAARYTFTGGTREAIAGGSRLTLTLRGGATVGLLVDTSGAIARLELNRTHRLYDGLYDQRILTRVKYGAQSVPTPATAQWATASALDESCATPTLRSDTRALAKEIATYANRKADGRTTATDVKNAARGWTVRYLMSKKLIKAGARITGRSSLLPRPYVFDVVIRNGKAVVVER